MSLRRLLVAGSIALVLSGVVHAKPTVVGQIAAFVVSLSADGTERIEPTDATAPGQTLEFRIVFTNTGDESVRGINVVDPIPENTRFVADSHTSDVDARFDVSVDGGLSFESEPVKRIETRADGTREEVIVPPQQYTHVRWIAEPELASEGGSHSFAYRVVVD